MTDDRHRVVVMVGASVRAIAESAARAGWSAHAADLFADLDLRRAATAVVRVGGEAPPGYPHGLPAAVASFPPGPWLYTGALENHPDTIDAIAATRPLAGNDGATVRAVRDHARLGEVIRAAGLRSPRHATEPSSVPTDGSFLVKPMASAGGRGIRRWFGRTLAGGSGPFVWQRFVVGAPFSAGFVAGPTGCRLLAVSRPLTGRAWCGARGFAYCGSVDAPLDDVRDRVRRQFDRIGEALAAAFRLTGLFGVDTIIDPRGHVHVLEVNPRPTASMELYERATGTSIASLHLAACGFGDVRTPSPAIPGIWSKAIVFAPRGHRTITPSAARVAATGRTWADSDGAAAIADLPRGGQRLPPGAPLVTVFARGDTPARSLAILRTRVGAVRRLSTASVSRPSARLPRRRRHRARTA